MLLSLSFLNNFIWFILNSTGKSYGWNWGSVRLGCGSELLGDVCPTFRDNSDLILKRRKICSPFFFRHSVLEDKTNTLFRNVGYQSHSDAMPHQWRREASTASLRKPTNSHTAVAVEHLEMLSHICGTGLNIPMPGLLYAPATSNQGSGFHPFVTLLLIFLVLSYIFSSEHFIN